ncbi:MAG: hypothetical protein A2Z26_04025 [Deltaproteobacteria bacterium RBG_16_66_15]|nr:MAG: hypothetical protein A2X90_01485 [Deltaproteobacteria bacterium GWA2_65_63]OGP29039.1 MAG: hypothetical protein A2X91_00705 [Deltaproteobacteria bacterium GWB2_65_81]OGP38227.1 MAG: hypothetical protein A2X98_08600 [Deltaproteobacteria bacterium GWC2_66_88]OGP79693.1 MAG: hypothetical protein A2Z26_04025 [Deltaproteobacteria bacterium RBG_16_66_15]
MRNVLRTALFLLGCTVLFAASDRIGVAGEGRGTWEESTPGRWESLPERRVGGTDNGISVEMTMAPGTGVSYARTGRWEPGPAVLRFAADNVNSGRNDYFPGEAAFPASVTFVFGKDSLKLGAKRRVSLLLRQVWNGFTPSGIRLTYAWGNGLPVGSMYRLWEEETVFVVAGPEEVGKTVSTARRLVDDFGAAYGRPPVGGVTEVRVSARRPSREKGPVRASITVRFPAPPE